MKKLFKRKEQVEMPQPQDETSVLTLLQEIKTQLVFLEKKIDALSIKPQERHQERHFSHDRGERDSSFSPRGFKAVCAECGQPCEVPFKPTGDRPVYCRTCFSKREGGSFEGRRDSRPRTGGFNRERHGGGRNFGGDNRGFGKRSAAPFRGKKRF
jgi:CxxC-x17-CxxC domain-containing protein